jgi:hypothetical protein
MIMSKKISNQFLGNFWVMFLLTIVATVLAFILLSVASGWIAGSLSKNRYSASAIIKEDYHQIDTSGVVENGGGVQVIDKDYRLCILQALIPLDKTF